MARFKNQCLASIPEESGSETKLTRAEFRQLMLRVDDEYIDPDFAATIVELEESRNGTPDLFNHSSFGGASVRPHRTNLDHAQGAFEATGERVVTRDSVREYFEHTEVGAQLVEDEEDPSDEDIPQFHHHFEPLLPNYHDLAAKNLDSALSISPESEQSDFQERLDRNRPLTGNEFLYRRPPPGFNLLHSVQASVDAYNKILAESQSQSRPANSVKRTPSVSSSPPTTSPSVTPRARETAPRSPPAVGYGGRNATAGSVLRTPPVERDAERAVSGRETGASRNDSSKAEDRSTRRTPGINGVQSHRQFKPTARKARRRS
jgi:hypothetical protein